MSTTVKMNGTKAQREIKVIRRKTIVIKNAAGEEQTVKLNLKTKAETQLLPEVEKTMEELNNLFPKRKKKEEVPQYEHLSDVIFATELLAQLVKFKERNGKGRRGRVRSSPRNQPTNHDWS